MGLVYKEPICRELTLCHLCPHQFAPTTAPFCVWDSYVKEPCLHMGLVYKKYAKNLRLVIYARANSRQQQPLFAAHGACPNLCGVPQETQRPLWENSFYGEQWFFWICAWLSEFRFVWQIQSKHRDLHLWENSFYEADFFLEFTIVRVQIRAAYQIQHRGVLLW